MPPDPADHALVAGSGRTPRPRRVVVARLVLAGVAVLVLVLWILDRTGVVTVPRPTTLIVVVLHPLLQWPVRRWTRRRAVRRGKVEGALRRVPPPGAASAPGWRRGTLTATPGDLRYVPHVPGRMRFPRREAVHLGVTALHDTGRRTGWRSAWKLQPGLHVCSLDGSSGRFELALEGSDVGRLLAALGVPGG